MIIVNQSPHILFHAHVNIEVFWMPIHFLLKLRNHGRMNPIQQGVKEAILVHASITNNVIHEELNIVITTL